jgi:hypothetical protein
MPSVTIDHMIALTMLLAVILISIAAYSQIMGAATIQQQNHHVAMKASELADGILLNPGYPLNWGQSNSTPSAFGLQDPIQGVYSLSPFSLQRLMSSSQAPVYYSKTGLWYSNNSLGGGGSLLTRVGGCLNYTTAAKLLGVNGSYGFQLVIKPTLNVSFSEVNLNPLRLSVNVRGPGLQLSGAYLNYSLFNAVPSGNPNGSPVLNMYSGTAQTNTTGSALLEFASVDGSKYAYSIIVYAHLSGFAGSGYHSRTTITNNAVIVPLIQNFATGQVLLAHNWDINPALGSGTAALHFNSTFLVSDKNLGLRKVSIANSNGTVDYGVGKPYQQVQIPTSDSGILLVAYQKENTNEYGITMMPWGISPLGFSMTFGGDSSNADWVATELRQVTVNGISYQVKLAVWNIKGRQLWGYNQ